MALSSGDARPTSRGQVVRASSWTIVAAALMVGGPLPPPGRSLGPVLAPSGLRCGPRWAGGGFGEGKRLFLLLWRTANDRQLPSSGGSSCKAKLTPATLQVRMAIVAENSHPPPPAKFGRQETRSTAKVLPALRR